MEGFAEAVGEVAVVGLEGVGEGVAFGLEHEAYALVVVEHLIDGGCAAVGRNEERFNGWLGGRLVVFAVEGILVLLAFVLLHLLGVELLEVVVDRLNQMTAKSELAFACRGLGGNEEKEVRKDLAPAVVAIDIGQTGGEYGERAE